MKQGVPLSKRLFCLPDVKGNIRGHVPFYVVNETPQALFDGLLDEGFQDEVGLTRTSAAHDLDIHVQGIGGDDLGRFRPEPQRIGAIVRFEFF